MKNNNLLLLFLCSFLFSFQLKSNNKLESSPYSKALKPFHLEEEKDDDTDKGIRGKVLITGVAGINGFRNSLMLKYSFDGRYIDTYNETPFFNFGVDVGLEKKVSAGLAFGYQMVSLTTKDAFYSFTDSVYNLEDRKDIWKRYHFAFRMDYHIVAKKNIALYTGGKVGYNIYKVTSNNTDVKPDYIPDLTEYVSPSKYAFQAHFGFSYFAGGIFGFNTEVGLAYGGPYNFALGLTAKI